MTAALVAMGVCGLTPSAALPPELVGYDPSGQIRFSTPAEAAAKRRELIEWIWSGGLPTGARPGVAADIGDEVFAKDLLGIHSARVASVDRLDANVAPYDFHSIMYLIHPVESNANNKRLVLLNPGHRLDGVSAFNSGVEDTANRLLSEGFNVLMTDMPLTGFNTDNTMALPDGGATITIGSRRTAAHREMFRKLTPPVVRDGEVFRFFLEPFVQGVNHFLAATPDATDVSFVGLSGGGWSAHMAAAVDVRIANSFPVAGSLPLYARPFSPGSAGDTEQFYAPLYGEIDTSGDKIPDTAVGVASWLEIYALGGYGPGRCQVQVLGLYDTCFPTDVFKTYDRFVSGVVKKLGLGEWRFHSDRTYKGHMISPNVLNHVILPGLGGVSTPSLSSAALSNPRFETGAPSKPIFNGNAPGWAAWRTAGSWGGMDSGFPAFTGHGAGALIGKGQGDRAWLFQYLGTVAADDVGKTFTLSADFGGRAAGGKRSEVNLTAAFRTGTTAREQLGTVLGTAGVVNLRSGAKPIEYTSRTATWTPTAANIGTEVFAVLDLEVLENLDAADSQKQYMVDNVALSVSGGPRQRGAVKQSKAAGAKPFFEFRGWETLVDGVWFDQRGKTDWYKSERYLAYLDLVLDKAPEFSANALIFMGRTRWAEPQSFISYRAWPKLNSIYEERGKADRELQCKRLNEVIAKGKEKGVDTYLWGHELFLPGELTKLYPGMKGEGSSFCPSSPEFLKFISSKYEELYDRLPGLAGTFLVLNESQISLVRGVPCRCERCGKSSTAEVVEQVIRAVYEPTAVRGKKLVVRLFARYPNEIAHICDAINNMPEELGFAVMAKACPSDFFGLQYPEHFGFQQIKGRPMYMEEVIGEFRGKTHIPLVPWKFYRKHIRSLAKRGGDGVVMRLDFNGFPKHNFEHPNEFNVYYAAKLWENPDADPDRIFKTWFDERYGPKAAEYLIPAFKNTEDIWEWSSNSLGVYLNSAHGNLSPIFRGSYSAVGNIEHISKCYSSHPDWSSRIRRLQSPDDAICSEVLAESQKALRLAEKSRVLVKQAKPHLEPEQYKELHGYFERFRYANQIFEGTKRLYLFGVRALRADDPTVRQRHLALAANATRELMRVAKRLEQEEGRNAWPIQPDDGRGSNLYTILEDYWTEMDTVLKAGPDYVFGGDGNWGAKLGATTSAGRLWRAVVERQRPEPKGADAVTVTLGKRFKRMEFTGDAIRMTTNSDRIIHWPVIGPVVGPTLEVGQTYQLSIGKKARGNEIEVSAAEESGRGMKYTSRSRGEAVAWQKTLRAKLFRILKLDDLVSRETPLPFNPKVLSSKEYEGYTQQEVEISTTPGRRIKVVLTLPATPSAPCPAVVCIHGHNGNRHIVYDSSSLYRGFATALAQKGYATISTDVGQHQVYEKNRTLMGERLWDLMRCVDYLESMPQIDKSRIGCGGLSLGGEMAMWLGAMDERVHATVSSGFLTRMDQMERDHCRCWKFPGLRELVDFSDVYSLTAPRAILCQNGLKEPGTGFTVAIAREALEDIRLIYADMKHPENVSLAAHEGGHEIDLPSLLTFFDEHLAVIHAGAKARLRRGNAQTPGQAKAELAELERSSPDLATWKQRRALLRREILRGAALYPLPRRTPLSPIERKVRTRNGYTV